MSDDFDSLAEAIRRVREAEAECDRLQGQVEDLDAKVAQLQGNLADQDAECLRLAGEFDRLREALERIAGNQIEWEEDEAGEIMAFARRVLEGTSDE